MRLPAAHYGEMKRLIGQAGVQEDSWRLIKRRGRIRLEIESHAGFFEFFKRKSVQIDEQTHGWVRSHHYEILTQAGPATVAAWEEVLTRLRQWLAQATTDR